MSPGCERAGPHRHSPSSFPPCLVPRPPVSHLSCPPRPRWTGALSQQLLRRLGHLLAAPPAPSSFQSPPQLLQEKPGLLTMPAEADAFPPALQSSHFHPTLTERASGGQEGKKCVFPRQDASPHTLLPPQPVQMRHFRLTSCSRPFFVQIPPCQHPQHPALEPHPQGFQSQPGLCPSEPLVQRNVLSKPSIFTCKMGGVS